MRQWHHLNDLPHGPTHPAPAADAHDIRALTIQALMGLPCLLRPCVHMCCPCRDVTTVQPDTRVVIADVPPGGPAQSLGPPWVGLAAVGSGRPLPAAAAGANPRPRPGKPGPPAAVLGVRTSCCFQPPEQNPTSSQSGVLVCDAGSLSLCCLPLGTVTMMTSGRRGLGPGVTAVLPSLPERGFSVARHLSEKSVPDPAPPFSVMSPSRREEIPVCVRLHRRRRHRRSPFPHHLLL